MSRLRSGGLAVLVAIGAVAVACGGGSPQEQNVDPIVVQPGDDAGPGGFGDAGKTDPHAAGCTVDTQCTGGTVCNHGTCLPPQGPCVTNASCEYDTYCETSSNSCVPYLSAPEKRKNDPDCKLASPTGVLSPLTKCDFSKAPAGDAFPHHVDVQATPMVANFHPLIIQPDTLPKPSGPPSIVAAFTAPVDGSYTEDLGIVRVLSGEDCSLEANLGGVDLNGDGTTDWVRSSSPVALADLDGDKLPEIVVYMADDSTVAFTKKKDKPWTTLWTHAKATLADGATVFHASISGGWAGPSIHDLDDDGKPEIIREAWVIDGLTGKLRASPPADYMAYYVGVPAVLANVDDDIKVEMTNGAHMWEFDPATNTWVDEPGYTGAASTKPGWTAVADLNAYDKKATPEIVVATTGTLAVYDVTHTEFMGMEVAVPGGGGGPPTIADYDGDGLPEIGLAGADYYTVFDPDCQGTPRTGGKCADRTHCDFATGGACPDKILWSKKTQDHSSNITGSSVFDFDADGIAEVVYADECFARIYSGNDGHVVFSQYHSSCTWLENPIVADVDGDLRAEMVVPSNTACGPVGEGIACGGSLDENGVDAAFIGVGCKVDADCAGGGKCDAGYCRCTTSAECCDAKDSAKCVEAGTTCAPPPAGTPGAGKTCRAGHPHGVQGIRVFKDAANRWVRSRTIWNQHAYAITHVNDDGTVPKTSTWAKNWTTPGLDNFRQNVPGTGDGKSGPDLTAASGPLYTCTGGKATFTVPICNRGSAPVAPGATVTFSSGGTATCSTTTAQYLDVGQCETVGCTWATPPQTEGAATDVTVLANDGDKIAECDTTNDKGLVTHVFCTPPR